MESKGKWSNSEFKSYPFQKIGHSHTERKILGLEGETHASSLVYAKSENKAKIQISPKVKPRMDYQTLGEERCRLGD